VSLEITRTSNSSDKVNIRLSLALGPEDTDIKVLNCRLVTGGWIDCPCVLTCLLDLRGDLYDGDISTKNLSFSVSYANSTGNCYLNPKGTLNLNKE